MKSCRIPGSNISVVIPGRPRGPVTPHEAPWCLACKELPPVHPHNSHFAVCACGAGLKGVIVP